MSHLENIRLVAQQCKAGMVDFTQRIVRIPSLSGQEKDIAYLISAEMKKLGYDEVWFDEAGNVIGKINGSAGPAVMLNGHIDHVDPGPIAGWPYPPFSGEIVDGELWGRASVDMKGPVACMIYAAGLFKQIDVIPPSDLFMTVVVMEETGGVGTQYLVSHLKAAAAICGEPSRNILKRGHRGRVELELTVKGRSAHASVPHIALNPHYNIADFLAKLSILEMAQDEILGISTVAPTLYSTDQNSPNVTPSEITLTLDWRNVPAESPAEIVAKVQRLLDSCLSNGAVGTVKVAESDFETYTGLARRLPAIFPSFLLATDNIFLQSAKSALMEFSGQKQEVDIWRFATDGGHLMEAGIPTIGFGPGDDSLPHTNRERINLVQMEEALPAYAVLSLALSETARKEGSIYLDR